MLENAINSYNNKFILYIEYLKMLSHIFSSQFKILKHNN